MRVRYTSLTGVKLLGCTLYHCTEQSASVHLDTGLYRVLRTYNMLRTYLICLLLFFLFIFLTYIQHATDVRSLFVIILFFSRTYNMLRTYVVYLFIHFFFYVHSTCFVRTFFVYLFIYLFFTYIQHATYVRCLFIYFLIYLFCTDSGEERTNQTRQMKTRRWFCLVCLPVCLVFCFFFVG